MPVLRSYKFSKQLCSLSDITCLNKYKGKNDSLKRTNCKMTTTLFFITLFLGKWINIYPDTDRDELDFERENSVRCPKCIPTCTYVSYSVASNYAYLVQTNKATDLQ